MVKKIIILIVVVVVAFLGYKGVRNYNMSPKYSVGQKIDQLNNVAVYYNGGVDNVLERNTVNGYNLGLKYQCVEFVKRYYYEYYNHKMPDSYGHAKSFYLLGVADGSLNNQRNLKQYSNPSNELPKEGDLIVFSETLFNKYGHVAIIAHVFDDEIEIIQQNSGPFSSSRERFDLIKLNNGLWEIDNARVLGWLRK